MPQLQLSIDFGGGADLLVRNKVKHHDVTLDTIDENTAKEIKWTLGSLLGWIRDNLLTPDRPELFLKDKTEKNVSKLDVRPGILVLVNDADWELVGQTDYLLESGDNVTFISTLHGG
jgi:ubiquitin related modifier 1